MSSASDSDRGSSCDVSGMNSEQYCSLLESITSLLYDDRLETDSATEINRLVDLSTDVVDDSSVSRDADGDSCEHVKKADSQSREMETVSKTSDGECVPSGTTLTADCQLVSRKLSEEDVDDISKTVAEENTGRIVNKLNLKSKLGITAGQSGDKYGRGLVVAENDVNSLIVECGSTSTNLSMNSNTSLSVEECVSDEDDVPLMELCSRKAGHENGCEVADARESRAGVKSDKSVVATELSDNVLWKEGDIEVRLEIGEDESSNSPTCDDDAVKTSDLCPAEDMSDLPSSKMPRTSIRISLSKLTARINGDDAAKAVTKCPSRGKESAVGLSLIHI